MSRFPEFALQEDYYFKAVTVLYQRYSNSTHWDDTTKLTLYDRSTLHETSARYPDEYQINAPELSGLDLGIPTPCDY